MLSSLEKDNFFETCIPGNKGYTAVAHLSGRFHHMPKERPRLPENVTALHLPDVTDVLDWTRTCVWCTICSQSCHPVQTQCCWIGLSISSCAISRASSPLCTATKSRGRLVYGAVSRAETVPAHCAAGCVGPCSSFAASITPAAGGQLLFCDSLLDRESMLSMCNSLTSGGGYTNTDPESRRIRVAPNEVRGRTKVKVVYVVLEAQYQASISAGVRRHRR